MPEFLGGNIPIWAVIAWAVFMAAVQGLPRPAESAALWYVWLYATAHGLSLNLALTLNPRNAPASKQVPSA